MKLSVQEIKVSIFISKTFKWNYYIPYNEIMWFASRMTIASECIEHFYVKRLIVSLKKYACLHIIKKRRLGAEDDAHREFDCLNMDDCDRDDTIDTDSLEFEVNGVNNMWRK